MKVYYYSDTDTLSIGFKDTASSQTEEIAPDVTIDFDSDGNLISIDIDLASQKLSSLALETKGLTVRPSETLKQTYETLIEARKEIKKQRSQAVHGGQTVDGQGREVTKDVLALTYAEEILYRLASHKPSKNQFTIELGREGDGRVIAEVLELPGLLVYGETEEEAIEKVQDLACELLADRVDHGEAEEKMIIIFRIAINKTQHTLT